MNDIINDTIYLGLNRLFFIDKNLEFKSGGVFDISGSIRIGTYKSGYIFRPNLDLFDDSIYKDKPCISIQFDHHLLSIIGIRSGPSHVHEKIIVSTNPHISIKDMYHQTGTGDIFIFGSPIKARGEVINDNLGEVMLWEVEPFLSKEDMERLINDISACTMFKKEMVESKTLAKQATTEAALQLSRSVAAESVNITFYTIINVLLAKLESYNKQMIEMRISVSDKLQAGIEHIEKDLDLGVPWDVVNENSAQQMIENLRSDINYLTALKNLNPDPSDQVKEHAYLLALQICGADFIRQRLALYDPNQPLKHSTSLAGLTTNFLERQMQANPNAQQLLDTVSSMQRLIRDRFDRNGGNMRDAIADVGNMNLPVNRGYNNGNTGIVPQGTLPPAPYDQVDAQQKAALLRRQQNEYSQ